MKRKKTLVGLVLVGTLIGLAPARTEACDFFRRLFGGSDYEAAVAPPAISPGVPVYSEEPTPYDGTTAYYYPGYRTTAYYYPATRTYYRAPVRYYYRAPSTTAYYAGTGCSRSQQPTEAPAPEPESASPEEPQTYAPEDAPEPTLEQQLRKPTPAEEQSGMDDMAPADSDADSLQEQNIPEPELTDPSDENGLQGARRSSSGDRRPIVKPLPATPRTVDASYANRYVLKQPKPRVAQRAKPRWVPVPRETSIAKR